MAETPRPEFRLRTAVIHFSGTMASRTGCSNKRSEVRSSNTPCTHCRLHCSFFPHCRTATGIAHSCPYTIAVPYYHRDSLASLCLPALPVCHSASVSIAALPVEMTSRVSWALGALAGQWRESTSGKNFVLTVLLSLGLVPFRCFLTSPHEPPDQQHHGQIAVQTMVDPLYSRGLLGKTCWNALGVGGAGP